MTDQDFKMYVGKDEHVFSVPEVFYSCEYAKQPFPKDWLLVLKTPMADFYMFNVGDKIPLACPEAWGDVTWIIVGKTVNTKEGEIIWDLKQKEEQLDELEITFL